MISAVPGFGTACVVNAGNLGSGVPVFRVMTQSTLGGNVLEFNTLVAGGGIQILRDSPAIGDILIQSTAPGALSIWEYHADNSNEGTSVVLNPANPSYTTAANLVFPILNPEQLNPGTVLIFDKSNGAFRAGQATTTAFQQANRGPQSVAFGLDNVVVGSQSSALGGTGHAIPIAATNSTVAGGVSNTISSLQGFIGGGSTNLVSGAGGVVGGVTGGVVGK